MARANPWSARPIWIAVDGQQNGDVCGTVLDSAVDRDGFRAGEKLTVPRGRIIDLGFVGSDGRPNLNEPRALFMVDKRVLVGLTVLSEKGDLVEQTQFVGTVESVDRADGIRLVLDDGASYSLPPDARAFEEAAPGEYTLRSNGQTVVDPDYVCTWTVTRPDDRYGPPSSGFSPA